MAASLIDLASENKDLKNKVLMIITNLDHEGVHDLEDQVCILMTNMMNFFSSHIEEIPSFESFSEEQKKALLIKFKKVAHKLKTKKIRTIDEMLQNFIFTILNQIEDRVESMTHMTAEEIMNKKTKQDFKKFLRHAASHQIYNLVEEAQEEEKSKNFIHNAVLLGVREAMKHAGLELKSSEVNQDSFNILENVHKTYKKASAKFHAI